MTAHEVAKNDIRILQLGFAVPTVVFDAAMVGEAYPQVQTSKLLWRLISGIELAAECSIDLLGTVPVSDYPRNPKVFYGLHRWSHKANASDIVLPFVNLIFLKHFTRFLAAVYFTILWLFKNRDVTEKRLLIYAMHSPFMLVGFLVSKLTDVKVILIVPDLPAYMNEGIKMGRLRSVAKQLDATIINWMVNAMDGLILLTKHAAAAIGSRTTPKLIVEGAISPDQTPSFAPLAGHASNTRIVMFTGALVGLDLLLDAFELIQCKNIQLHLSGKGPMAATVIEAAQKNSRITYLGFMTAEILHKRMEEATVFINVRSASTPFIEFSFPSKLLEYMATGRPTISTALPGIPDDYHRFLYMLRDESPECLAQLITKICSKSNEELDQFGNDARDFVKGQKSYTHQGARILKFVQSL